MRAVVLTLLAVSCSPVRKEAPAQNDASLSLVDVEVMPEGWKPPEAPKSVRWERKAGSYSTSFANSGKGARRKTNIALAASLLDGAVVPPGGTFRFNEAVGPRTALRGFVPAPALFLGEKVTEVGGGVCQVSSTMYAAALASRIEVLSRTPHSRPSDYIMAGLDATVTSGCAASGAKCEDSDLVLRNQTPAPIGVKAAVERVKDGTDRVTVSFHGFSPNWTTRFRSTFSWGDQEPERRIKRTRVAGDGRRKVQEGFRSRNAFLRVLHSGPSGDEIVSIPTSYPAVPEIWEVGSGFSGDAPWAEVGPADAGTD